LTRLAILADVHGDVEALRDALGQIDRLGCDEIVCAGDLVGYGAYGEEVIALVRERRRRTASCGEDRAGGEGVIRYRSRCQAFL
jgi:Icc-related predicted phosphoesterase